MNNTLSVIAMDPDSVAIVAEYFENFIMAAGVMGLVILISAFSQGRK